MRQVGPLRNKKYRDFTQIHPGPGAVQGGASCTEKRARRPKWPLMNAKQLLNSYNSYQVFIIII